MKIEKQINYWARALFTAIQANPEKDEEILKNLAQSLGRKKHLLPAILKKFNKLYQRENRVNIILANKLDEKTEERLKKKVLEILGKEKEINTIFDKNLIAGFQIKTKDIFLKASLRDELNKLKNKIYGYN